MEKDMTFSDEQRRWLKDIINAETLGELLGKTKKIVPSDLVPTLLIAGRTGCGKSSILNALAKRPVSETGEIPTTQLPEEHELDEEGLPLRAIDVPGIGEAGKAGQRLEDLLNTLHRAHLLILTVACPERSFEYECSLLKAINNEYAGREPLPTVLVCNKLDLAAPVRDWNPATLNLVSPSTEKEHNIREWLSYVQDVLQPRLPQWGRAVPCSAGASWNDTENQYGIGALRQVIYDMLPEATQTYFARAVNDVQLVDRRAEEICRNHAIMAGAAAAQPFPSVPDAVLIMPVQLAMICRLTRLYGREMTSDLASKLVGPFLARYAGRFVVEQVSKIIPGVGSVLGAAVAGSLTYSLGMAFHTLLHEGNWNPDLEALKDALELAWKKSGKDFRM